MKYLMLGDEWKDTDVVYVDVKKTPNSVIITPISPQPKYTYGRKSGFTYGCIDKLWDKGKIVIREPKLGSRIKITRDYIKDWGDGSYTFYPERAGLPYLLIPKEENE